MLVLRGVRTGRRPMAPTDSRIRLSPSAVNCSARRHFWDAVDYAVITRASGCLFT